MSAATTKQTKQSQGSNEWYTPPWCIEAALAVMGGIDLDPASCALANETVKAARYYDKTMNGLEQPWSIDGRPSRVWLNPPYGLTVPLENQGRFKGGGASPEKKSLQVVI
jgi:DNA N-6-adenine-methyltransferase (Dam)